MKKITVYKKNMKHCKVQMNGVAETEKKRKKRGERGVEREIDVKRITISQPGAEHCSMDLGIRMRYHRHGLRAVH